jgi:hypothetical protein
MSASEIGDPGAIVADVMSILALAHPEAVGVGGMRQPAERVFETPVGLVGLAAGPDPRPGADPRHTLVAVTLGAESEIAFLGVAMVNGTIEVLRYDGPGPWLKVVAELAESARNMPAGIYPPTSVAIH